MNRPFARASVASARSAPAKSRPRPANVTVPSISTTATRSGEMLGPGRQPRTAAATVTSRITWAISTTMTASILAAMRPPRVMGEPPSRFSTP